MTQHRDVALPITCVILLLAASGCVSAPDNEAKPSVTAVGSGMTGADETAAAQDLVSLSACERRWIFVDWPPEMMKPSLPEGITPRLSNGVLMAGGFHLITCREAVVNQSVTRPFFLAWFDLVINKPSRPAENVSNHKWLLEVFTNDPGFAAMAKERGLEIEIVREISVVESAATASRTSFELAVPSESPQYAVRGYRPSPSGDYQERLGYYWGKTARDTRAFALEGQGKLASTGHGEISFGAGSYWSERSPTASWPVSINYLADNGAAIAFQGLPMSF